MTDLSAVEGKVEDAKGGLSESRSPQSSDSCTAVADLPRTPTKEVTGHTDGFKDTVELPVENKKCADTEQGSKIVTVLSPVSPPSSESRANLRTEKLNDSPLERRGFNKAPLSFGSVVANAPAPVLTGAINRFNKKLGLPEQPPQMRTPSLQESVNYMGRSRTDDSISVSNSCRATAPAESVDSRSTAFEQYGLSDTDQIATFQTVDEIMGVNPYLRRADEIGFRHQVPGIGHLGSSLVPHGWKEGDPPITPAEAKKLFDIDRREAVHDLEMSLASQKHLNGEEKEQFSASIDDQWKARLLLDRTVLAERLLIHKQHHERKRGKMEGSRGDEQSLSQNRLSEVPQPIHPRATASYMPAPLPESPYWRRISNFPNEMDSRFRDPRTSQNVESWQSHIAPEKSPIALDHNQLATRSGSAYSPYQPNTAEITRQAFENQQYFNMHGSLYKPCGAQEQLSHKNHPSSMGIHPTVCFEGNNVWTPQHGCPPEQGSISQYRSDPFTYNSYPHIGSFGLEYPPIRSASLKENILPRPAQYLPFQSGYGGSANTNIYHSNYDPFLRERPYEENPQYVRSHTEISPTRDRSVRRDDLLKNSQYEINKTRYPSGKDAHVPELGQQPRQEPSNRIQYGQKEDRMTLRHESHLAQQSIHKATGIEPTFDLPIMMKETPELNERVAETNNNKTGQWYGNEAELENLPTLIPSKEFVRAALEEAERDREGAKNTPRKRRPKPEIDATRGFSVSDAAAKLLILKGAADNRNDSQAASSGAMLDGITTFPSATPAPGGLSSTYKPSPPQKKKQEVTPESENGSDPVEDPNDGDYGKRTTRRKPATPRKHLASRSNASLKKKRKSAAVSVTPVKRTRLSVHSPANNSEDDAEGSDDPGA